MYAIEMLNITKKFGDFYANKDITIQVKKNEVHALLGENGAGKSTLMSVLFGMYQQEEGVIKLNGKEVKIKDPKHANELGIGMVHQHFKLIKNFTVAENIILGMEEVKGGKIDIEEASKKIHDLSIKYGLEVNPTALVSDITVGMQQRVEILKMLYRDADILIFDEPTAVLTPAEIEEFLVIIKNLQAEGKTILLITHKLNEIKTVADSCSIIRRGEYFGTVEVAATPKEKLASLMIGKDLEKINYERSRDGVKKTLEIKSLYADTEEKKDKLHDFNLEVREREILGIAGVDGNGQKEFVEVLNNLLKSTKGEIFFDGQEISKLSTSQRKEVGLEIIAEDRHKDGLVLDFSVKENSILENYYTEKFASKGFLKPATITKFAKELCEKYDVRKAGDENISARSMSGGNQQKLIIGRALEMEPKLLVTTQPTRGLDVGAINGIHKMLINYRDKGNAVLLISYDLDEILTLSDRIAVIHNGNIIDVVDNDENVTKEQLGLLMAGVKK
ncbi:MULTISPECIES: ABC transporter ATP-binding protein [unclassified Gemella]|uniref:ABC transporter ATP-binding protein n=1 Tax=unclassified Gemella TaxID=2624949 RepID=UPI001073B10D|nr:MULTISPECIES: ABC transporter ATP-binding protein [unclassified Gemella]MBF0710734.1 ABC transporter ATP-binding protein [Gemella sp. GL1.1]MBF0746697.1 ABC transporter ATP-binding protein [Gemella sp. 19428wG2_WT2a]NYS28078.1 ABC transporter ATP-binding protein [Gemella sp. GL1]TFU60046.1 ABC transporter ATP-binding protein [Gemella sp. WT2a]